MNDYRRRASYSAGYRAAHNGKPETANNRPPGTIYYDDWHDGYLLGLHDKEKGAGQ